MSPGDFLIICAASFLATYAHLVVRPVGATRWGWCGSTSARVWLDAALRGIL